MSATAVTVVGLIYLAGSVEQFAKGQPGMAIMYLGYAIGNVGAWMLVVR